MATLGVTTVEVKSGYGLSVAEVWLGATRLAARSLGSDAGVLAPGAPADLVLWDLPREQDVLLPWGVACTTAVLRGGQLLAGSLA